jgi:undecaprenyl diphosphate synthase
MVDNFPQHIAIIMDGNGRWAERRGLPRIMGHRAGIKTAERIVKASQDLGVKILTLYTFSTENWKRPKKEVSALLKILADFLRKDDKRISKYNICLKVIGRIDELPRALRISLSKAIKATGNNDGLIVNLAINYGGRPEIVDAVRKIAQDVLKGELPLENIDEEIFSRYLYTSGLPDPDIIIRTGGEFRLSNFLLWQASYSEFYISKKLWPDFTHRDLELAINALKRRERRFGDVI